MWIKIDEGKEEKKRDNLGNAEGKKKMSGRIRDGPELQIDVLNVAGFLHWAVAEKKPKHTLRKKEKPRALCTEGKKKKEAKSEAMS